MFRKRERIRVRKQTNWSPPETLLVTGTSALFAGNTDLYLLNMYFGRHITSQRQLLYFQDTAHSVKGASVCSPHTLETRRLLFLQLMKRIFCAFGAGFDMTSKTHGVSNTELLRLPGISHGHFSRIEHAFNAPNNDTCSREIQEQCVSQSLRTIGCFYSETSDWSQTTVSRQNMYLPESHHKDLISWEHHPETPWCHAASPQGPIQLVVWKDAWHTPILLSLLSLSLSFPLADSTPHT